MAYLCGRASLWAGRDTGCGVFQRGRVAIRGATRHAPPGASAVCSIGDWCAARHAEGSTGAWKSRIPGATWCDAGQGRVLPGGSRYGVRRKAVEYATIEQKTLGSLLAKFALWMVFGFPG